jgi:type IV pilus assembly protein PilB
MIALREAGLEKIRQGLTSIEEVLKKTSISKEAMPAYLVNPDLETYEDGNVIIQEGKRGLDFFELVQGSLVVMKDDGKISEIVQPGEYFGEMAAISGEPRSTTVISRGRSTVRRYPGDKLGEIIEKYPEVAKDFFQMVIKRLKHANKLIASLKEYKELTESKLF